jgi:transcriptional regulator with XRE-family HTH domain
LNRNLCLKIIEYYWVKATYGKVWGKITLTLRQLAAMLGHSSHSYVTNLERSERKPSAEMAVKIADVFNVTTDQLLRDELEVE